MWLVCCVYPSFDVDGHEEPAQKDDYDQRLKQTKTQTTFTHRIPAGLIGSSDGDIICVIGYKYICVRSDSDA